MPHEPLSMSHSLGNAPHLRETSVRPYQRSTPPPTHVTSWVCFKVQRVCLEQESISDLRRHLSSLSDSVQTITTFPSAAYFPLLCLTGCDDSNKAERRLAPLQSRQHLPFSADTEMRTNYQQPKLKPELLHNVSQHSRNRDTNVGCCGIGTV